MKNIYSSIKTYQYTVKIYDMCIHVGTITSEYIIQNGFDIHHFKHNIHVLYNDLVLILHLCLHIYMYMHIHLRHKYCSSHKYYT